MASPLFPRGDENAPARRSPPKKISTAGTSGTTKMPKSPLNPNAPSFTTAAATPTKVDTRATLYSAKMPHYHPPYEEPIDGRFCLHFDSSATFGDPVLLTADGKPRKIYKPGFRARLIEIANSLTPPTNLFVDLQTCTTAAARALCHPDLMAHESPLMFRTSLFEDEISKCDLHALHDQLTEFLEEEFSREEFPECYVSGQVVIRFALSPEDVLFAAKSSAIRTPLPSGTNLLTPPVQVRTVPRTIEAVYGHEGRFPPKITSALSSEPYREFFAQEGTLFGSSLAVYGQRGEVPVGTLGIFLRLTDLRTGKLLLDEDGNTQIFGLTCAHVVRSSNELVWPDNHLENAPTIMANLGRRDRENTRRRHSIYPSSRNLKIYRRKKKLVVKQAHFVREHLKLRALKDDKTEYHNVGENAIGSLYLSSGRRPLKITNQLLDFTINDQYENAVAADYALIKMDPKVYSECKNQLPEEKFPLWHPADADIVRSHRGFSGIKPLNPGMVVMKAGRSTGTTFGKIPGHRIPCELTKVELTVTVSSNTSECLVTALQQDVAFSRHGDSGAAVMDVSDGSLVGMVMGGRRDDISRNYVTPIQVIQADLAETFNLSMELHMSHYDNVESLAEEIIEKSFLAATKKPLPSGPWENGTDGSIEGVGLNKDGELCFVVPVRGSEGKFEVPRSMLNTSWQRAIKDWDARVKAASARTPLKRPRAAEGSNYNSPAVAVAARLKQRRQELPDRSK